MENRKILLGKRIKELRKSRNMTQPELAEKISVDPKYISRLETGTSTPSLDTLHNIADALCVEIAEIFTFSYMKDREELIFQILNKLKTTNSKNVKIIYNITNAIVNMA